MGNGCKMVSGPKQELIEEFTYFNCGKDWAQTHHLKITGARQSPINIEPGEVLSNPGISFSFKFTKSPIETKTQYTPNSFKTIPCEEPIAEITVINEKKQKQVYQSKSLQFHCESEHTIGKKKFAAELHIIFARTGNLMIEDNNCVIGILFEIQDEDHVTAKERDCVNIFKPSTPSIDMSVEYSKLFDPILNKKKFYHYKGSLTTPPCTESVLWWVFQSPVRVLFEDVKPFMKRWIDDPSFSAGNGNCRSVCDLVGRKVYDITAD